MRIIVKPLILIILILPLSIKALKAQQGFTFDTTTVVVTPKEPQHLIGVRYGYEFTGVQINVDMKSKGVGTPLNFALLYTYYNPLWGRLDYFGLQTGIKYCSYGFKIEYADFYKNFQETITAIEIPFVSAFKVDLGKHFRILASLGAFGGYRLTTTKSNGWDCFDQRYDYGVIGGAGFAIRFKPVEFHIEASYQHSFSFLFHPEKLSSEWWTYTYPWQISISAGIHIQLK